MLSTPVFVKTLKLTLLLHILKRLSINLQNIKVTCLLMMIPSLYRVVFRNILHKSTFEDDKKSV